METTDLILSELRELRSAFSDNAQENGERLSALETSMKHLVGNGQPGRITLIEESVKKLQEWRWWIVGAGAGSASVVSCIGWFLRR